MSDKPKPTKKHFSAPIKKSSSEEQTTVTASTKKTSSVQKCPELKAVKKFVSFEQTAATKKLDPPIKAVEKKEPNQKKQPIEKGKPKQAVKSIPKSLTDEEYRDIFENVLNQTLNEVSQSLESTENLQQNCSPLKTLEPTSPDLSISVAKDSEDEFGDMSTGNPIDEWNDRPEKTDCQEKQVSGDENENKTKDVPEQKEEKDEITSSLKEAMDKKDQKKKDVFKLQHKCKEISSMSRQEKDKKNKSVSKPKEDIKETNTLPLKQKKKSKIKSIKSDTLNTVRINDCASKDNGDQEDDEDEEESGTWIQCTIDDCCKWRYVPDISDPLDVPDNWDCSMNSDKMRNTCDAPEVEYDESEHILTKFTLGSLVWAKMDGFPWWPAMIDTDPDYDTYFELPTATSMMPYLYHVTFVDEHVTRAWVRSHLITPYDHRSASINALTVKSRIYKKDLQAAVTNADKALKLSLQKRIDKYSFSKRFSKSKPKRMPGVGKIKKTKKERSTASEVLQSPDAMMREIEMAIETCNNSNDSDFSEDDVEYLPQKSRRLEPTIDPKSNLTHTEQDRNNSESESEENVKDKSPSAPTFDPSIFTMELSNTHSEDIRKSEDCNGDEIGDGNNDNDDTYNHASEKKSKKCGESIGKKYNLGKKNNLGKKRGKKYANDVQDVSVYSTESWKSDSITINEEKENKATDIPLSTEVDLNSANENKDHNDSKHSDVSPLGSHKKNRSQLEKTDSKKKRGKTASKNIIAENNDKPSTGDLNGVLKSKPKSKSSFVGVKKAEKKQAVEEICILSDINEGSAKNEVHNKTHKVLKLKKKKNQHDGHVSLDEEDIEQKDALHDKAETKLENKPVGNRKRKADDKGFVIPASKKSVCKAEDRNVPGSPCNKENIKPAKPETQGDQFVPDLRNEVIEEDINLSNHEIEQSGNMEKNSIEVNIQGEEEEDDSEHLNLSMDSLEGECLDIDVHTKGDDKSDCDTVETDKHEYGKFGGHCSEHGSDSDPFELIED